ncbi:LIRP isoform X3 [Nylanderia fulva]|uniref:LIRP isoform X3 n=1 Tax=Nylanderia fulva TaxID=613905 RepID=UPI0010FB015A|nr:LIRP isoform X3 [Nylanderia fulva]
MHSFSYCLMLNANFYRHDAPEIEMMSSNRLNVLVTLIIVVAFLATESGNAQADGYPQFDSVLHSRTSPQRYCGKKLSNALQLVCDGVYNSMFKKSGQVVREEANTGRRSTGFDYVRTQEMEMADYPYEPPPFLPRARARGMLDRVFGGNKRYRRQTRGIHEECCLNACSMNELATYCGSQALS